MMNYETYKDSGIEGLGLIPEHWEIDRVKNIGTIKGRVGWKALKASEYVDEGFFFLSTPNIKGVSIDFDNVNYITKERYYESPEIMLKVGDVLLVKDGSTLGIVNVIRELPDAGTVNSSIAILRLPKTNSIYWFYFFQSSFIQNFIQLKKDGMGVPHLFQRDIRNFDLLLPLLPEQKSIAQYLDTKTQAIDEKVKLLEQKIDYYKELRKSLINDAVTKGLDKTVRLKESGIDWIGQIPEYWKVIRIKDAFTTLAGGTPSTTNPEYWDGNIPWIQSGKVQNNIVLKDSVSDYITPFGLKESSTKTAINKSVLIALTGATCSNIGYLTFDTTINQSIVAISNTDNSNTKYLFYFLLSAKEKIRTLMSGGAQGGINQEDVKFLDIAYPPQGEQIEIAEYLDEKTETIDKIIQNILEQIDSFKELRKSLINDVVTGKIRVCEPAQNKEVA